MKNMWSDEIYSVLMVGRSLEAEGINNFALTEFSAMVALDRLECLKVGVLGGDVFFEENGRLNISYDNWYCNKVKLENNNEYVKRSINVARNFIKNYSRKDAFFSITPEIV